MSKEYEILPRILRCRAAPGYLGMCRDEFNKTVRPYVREFRIGIQGVGFDRYELDDWVDAYVARNAIGNKPRFVAESSKHQRHASPSWQGLTFKEALDLVAPKKVKKA
jgi:hypothetical protein